MLLAGSVSYTSQDAWILNCTLRDNVVLAGTYSEAEYQRVLQCCALLPDLKTLPGGATLQCLWIQCLSTAKSMYQACYANASLIAVAVVAGDMTEIGEKVCCHTVTSRMGDGVSMRMMASFANTRSVELASG